MIFYAADIELFVIYILDTSALFSMQDLPSGEAYTTAGVIAELNKYADPRVRFWEELLKISEPTKASLDKVNKAAESTGDKGRLSPVDIEVLALALDMDGLLLTDDYSIQNLARFIGIKYQGVGMKGIQKIIRWKYRCRGCGRVWDKEYPDCPVCGSPLKTVRSRE